jgi:hypothetical protein
MEGMKINEIGKSSRSRYIGNADIMSYYVVLLIYWSYTKWILC